MSVCIISYLVFNIDIYLNVDYSEKKGTNHFIL